MILSIDTYSDVLGVSLIDGHNLVVRQSYQKLKPFSELLMSRIDEVFRQLGYDPSVLYAVVVNKGPGSYTGLRVGITVAKTLAYSLNIPVYSYSSLEAMAYRYRFCNSKITAVINAGKGECYLQEFTSDGKEIKPVSEIKLIKISHFKQMDIDGLVVVKNVDINRGNVIHLIEDLSVDGAFYSLKKESTEDLMRLEPVYIRPL